MGKYMPDVQLLVGKADPSDDAVLISANVKNIVVACFVHGVEGVFDVGEVRKRARLNDLPPRLHRQARRGMNCREVDQRFVGNNSHAPEYRNLRYLAVIYLISDVGWDDMAVDGACRITLR